MFAEGTKQTEALVGECLWCKHEPLPHTDMQSNVKPPAKCHFLFLKEENQSCEQVAQLIASCLPHDLPEATAGESDATFKEVPKRNAFLTWKGHEEKSLVDFCLWKLRRDVCEVGEGNQVSDRRLLESQDQRCSGNQDAPSSRSQIVHRGVPQLGQLLFSKPEGQDDNTLHLV